MVCAFVELLDACEFVCGSLKVGDA